MPEQERVDLGALSDLCTPWCLHVVATLRIADHIAAGNLEIDKLAAVAGCDSDALHRVLGHLVSKGLFQETAPGRFESRTVTLGSPAGDVVRVVSGVSTGESVVVDGAMLLQGLLRPL